MLVNTISKRIIFYTFLIINALCWSCIQLLRSTMSIDAMEAISWGELISFGTNKHPPLSGWLMSSAYNLFGHYDFIAYALGQICILIGFIYIYKLAKYFISEEKAFCSVMILEACNYYTYNVFVDNFNCNVLLMMLWPIIIYYFYKAYKENCLKDWILLGLFSGLGALGKYQIIFLFFAMLMYLIFVSREQFKRKGLYIALTIGFLTFLPHIVWLFQNDFFSFSYMLDRTHSETTNLPYILIKLSHIFYPIKFIFGQFLSVIGCVVLYLILALQAKNISWINKEGTAKDKLFLLFICLVPIITQGAMGIVTGSRVPTIWGSVMVPLAGILLFYFFPINFKECSFKFFTVLIYVTLTISLIFVIIFVQLQTQFFIAFPKQKIMQDFDNIWNTQVNNAQLKYVAGDIRFVFYFRYYNKQRPNVILDTFGHKNPWADYEDIYKSGVIILSDKTEKFEEYARTFVTSYPSNKRIEPHKYIVDVCNKFNKCVQEEFYYTIIPPQKQLP